MKDKNLWIPLIIILTISLIGIIVYKYPISMVIMVLCIFVLIYIIQKKTHNDWGKMFAIGLPISLIIVALFDILFYFSRNNEILNNIMTWPGNQGTVL